MNKCLIKSIENEKLPKKHLIDKQFWFVNPGILSNAIYNNAVLFVGTSELRRPDFQFALFLGLKYLIHYIELFTFDNTPLLCECITKHLKYLQTLLGTQSKSKKYLNYRFISQLQYVFEKLKMMDVKDYISRQMHIDHLELYCSLFANRLKIWLKDARLQAYLYRYGFDPYRSSVIYNSFLIPNQRRYIDPLCRVDQTFIDKIEIKCNCKIMLSVESTECHLYPEFITLEVIFDLYRGNYLGFIEMFGYIVKRLNPTQYFAKSLRTVLIEGSIFYNILTNVPMRKLKYLEKTIVSGCPVTPFLSPDSVSKQLYSIIATIRDQDDLKCESHRKTSGDDEDETIKETELDFSIKNYYDRHSTQGELNKLVEGIDNINYSHRLLQYFQTKYDEEMSQIQKDRQIQKEEEEKKNKRKIFVLNQNNAFRPKTPKNVIPIIESLILNSNSKTVRSDKRLTMNSNETQRKKEKLPSNSEDTLTICQSLESSKKQKRNHENQSNLSDTNHNQLKRDKLAVFDNLSPIEQFKMLLSEPFDNYTTSLNWTNHKMRLMLRCDTEETIEDLKSPYLFEKKSIQERLHNRDLYEKKFSSPPSPTVTFSAMLRERSHRRSSCSKRSWVSKTASKMLSETGSSDQVKYNSHHSDSDSTLTSEISILNLTDLNKKFPEIAMHLKKYGKRLVDTFISRKLFKKQNWVHFLNKNLILSELTDLDLSTVCNFNQVFKAVNEKNSETINKFQNPLAKRIFALLMLITDGDISEKEFRNIIKGRGIHLDIIEKINKSQSSVPTKIGNLDKLKSENYLANLSRCLCQLMHDLILLAHEGSTELFYIFKYHVYIFEDITKNIKETDIKAALEVLNLLGELGTLNMKSFARRGSLNTDIIYLAEELSVVHGMIFRQPCCSYKLNNHLGLHIIYHSMQVDDRLNAVEPYLKLPGDRRIKKIEKMCNCFISLRTKKHQTININEYAVDIFYDFEHGNHFGALDLLKQMMAQQNKLMTIQNHRTVVAYPSGELWTFRNTDWLKKCYNINESDNKILNLFRNNEEIVGMDDDS